MPCYLKTFKAIFVTTMLLVPALSNASQTGIPGYSQSNSGSNSCHNCHSFSMMAPSNQLTISGSNTVLVGTTYSFTIKLVADESQTISYGGFDLSTSNGTLAPGDSETRIINSELVHSNRKATIDTGDSYDVQWNFNWQAPATAGSTTFFACGLPVNGDGKATEEDNSRDGRVACTTFNIQVQQPPAAIAGNNQTVTEGDAVTLDGSFSSDADGSITSYLWEQLSGTTTALNNANTDTANTTAPNVAANTTDELIFRLTVTDNNGLTNKDTMSVFVQDVLVSNLPPVASAGSSQNVNENTLVILDASASSDDGSIVSYLWEQTTGVNMVTLSNANIATLDFTAPAVDNTGDMLTFQLTVTDNLGVSATDSMTVTVNDVDTPPTAKITDASGVVISAINNNGQITLYGNFSSDPEGPITAYSWSQTAGPAIINPGVNNESSFSFTAPDAPGNSIDIQLTVTGDEGSVQNSITATLTLDNLPPVVIADVDQTVTEGNMINLQGTVTDANNNLVSVLWRQINCGTNCIMQPVNVALPLLTNNAQVNVFSPSITPDNNALALDFELIATDADGLSATSTTKVTINDNGITGFPSSATPFISFNNQPMAISVESLDPAVTEFISNLLPEDNTSVADNINRPQSFPYDLTSLEITLSAPGSVLVTLYFPEPVADDFDFYQYLDSNGWINTSKAKDFNDINFSTTTGWKEITEEAELSTDRRNVAFLLTDGGPGDQDPASLVISSKGGIGENQASTASQPGATGALGPLNLMLFMLSLYLFRPGSRNDWILLNR